MQLANECLCQWIACHRFFKNHFQSYIMSLHFLQVFHFCFTYDLPKQQKSFCLPIRKRIAFYMVGVEVKL